MTKIIFKEEKKMDNLILATNESMILFCYPMINKIIDKYNLDEEEFQDILAIKLVEETIKLEEKCIQENCKYIDGEFLAEHMEEEMVKSIIEYIKEMPPVKGLIEIMQDFNKNFSKELFIKVAKKNEIKMEIRNDLFKELATSALRGGSEEYLENFFEDFFGNFHSDCKTKINERNTLSIILNNYMTPNERLILKLKGFPIRLFQ